MAKLGELAGPVMCSTTCLQRYRATRLGCEEIQQLSSADPLTEYRFTPLIRSGSSWTRSSSTQNVPATLIALTARVSVLFAGLGKCQCT